MHVGDKLVKQWEYLACAWLTMSNLLNFCTLISKHDLQAQHDRTLFCKYRKLDALHKGDVKKLFSKKSHKSNLASRRLHKSTHPMFEPLLVQA